MLSEIEIDTLRSQGVSEEEIVLRNGGPLPFASFGEPEYMPMGTAMAGDEVDMGFSRDENGNPIINPDNLVSATPVFAPPEPSQAAVDAGIANDVNDPAYIQAQQQREQQQVQAQQSQAPVVQQQREQAEQMNGIGGPDTPVDNGLQGFDPIGSFLGGFASSQAPAYSGGLQAIAAAFGGGSAAMQRDMAVARKGVGRPNSVKEFEYAKANSGYTGSYTDFKDQFGGNMLLKAMAGQQAVAMKKEQTQYDRAQDAQSQQVSQEKEEYKRTTGTIPTGYESTTIGKGDSAYEVLRPQRGTKDYNNPMMAGNVIKDNIGDLQRMRDLTKKHGTELRGVVAGEMSTLRRTILQRITSTWEMGALGDQEYANLQKAIPDPGSWESGSVSTDQMVKQFEVFISDYNKQLDRTGVTFEDWGYDNPWKFSKDEVARFKKRKAGGK